MKRKMRGTALVLAGLMLLASTGCSSGGQTAATDEAEEGAWAPSGSIDFVCPYSAGGGSDIYARTLANVMSDGGYVDANIVVQNLYGGGEDRTSDLFDSASVIDPQRPTDPSLYNLG